MMLVDVSDVSAEVERARGEAEQRDLFAMFERMMKDRAGFLEFYAEAGALVGLATAIPPPPLTDLKRAVHTLKGNAGLYGAAALAGICHEIEAQLTEDGEASLGLALLAQRWDSLRGKLQILLGERAPVAVELDDEEYQDFLGAVYRNVPRAAAGSARDRLAARAHLPPARPRRRARPRARPTHPQGAAGRRHPGQRTASRRRPLERILVRVRPRGAERRRPRP